MLTPSCCSLHLSPPTCFQSPTVQFSPHLLSNYFSWPHNSAFPPVLPSPDTRQMMKNGSKLSGEPPILLEAWSPCERRLRVVGWVVRRTFWRWYGPYPSLRGVYRAHRARLLSGAGLGDKRQLKRKKLRMET